MKNIENKMKNYRDNIYRNIEYIIKNELWYLFWILLYSIFIINSSKKIINNKERKE